MSLGKVLGDWNRSRGCFASHLSPVNFTVCMANLSHFGEGHWGMEWQGSVVVRSMCLRDSKKTASFFFFF